MANKLDEMEISSTDLCKRGANQRALIKLFKSVEAEEGGEGNGDMSMIEKIAAAIQKALSSEGSAQPITKAAGTVQVRETTEALRKSLESIIADDSLSAVEKHDMMADSLQQFTLEATDLMDGWAAAIGKAEEMPEEDPEEDPVEDPEDDPEDDTEEDPEEDPMEETEEEEEPGDEPEDDMKKGVFDMATIDINKMSPEDKATLDALAKKYGAEEEPAAEIHPDVQKAIDEVAQLRKSLEIKELEGIAKKYEVIGKKAEELAPKLYDLKKAGEQHYNDFIALLDEQVQMADSGIFKEYGTSRGGRASDLDATVAELQKADPNLTRAQAVVKAFEINPGLDPFTGKAK